MKTLHLLLTTAAALAVADANAQPGPGRGPGPDGPRGFQSGNRNDDDHRGPRGGDVRGRGPGGSDGRDEMGDRKSVV